MLEATALTDCAMEARACTLRQQKLIELAERFLAQAAKRPGMSMQDQLFARSLLRQFAQVNDRMGEQHRLIAGLAEQFAPERESWSASKVIRFARPALEQLANPLTRSTAREMAECQLTYVIRAADPANVGSHAQPNAHVAHQLGPVKTRILWDLVDRVAA